jgi:hypothetical protein
MAQMNLQVERFSPLRFPSSPTGCCLLNLLANGDSQKEPAGSFKESNREIISIYVYTVTSVVVRRGQANP